ncbi:unnamed protein product [Rhizophagus irregularis]|nr:unnamed protein product [Rhizophagus irregularis]
MDELFTENYPDVSPRLACTYFIAELKVLINNLKPDSREHEKACTLKSRIKKTNKNKTFLTGRAGRTDKENLPQGSVAS